MVIFGKRLAPRIIRSKRLGAALRFFRSTSGGRLRNLFRAGPIDPAQLRYRAAD